MFGHRLTLPALCLLAACNSADVHTAPPGAAPPLSAARYVLRTINDQPLPEPATTDAAFPEYLADTITFDIAVAANVSGPLALSRAIFRDASGQDVPNVILVRYAQDGNHITFPPTCVPTENCPERFSNGQLDRRWMTLEVIPRFRGPLRYQRID